VLASIVWCFWYTIDGLARDWKNDPNYSVGQLVPFAALYLVWIDRNKLRQTIPVPCWWGVGVILCAMAARFFGLFFLYESAERYALVIAIVGTVVLVFGTKLAWQLRWILVFLFLMVPLPGRVHNTISGPLQDAATSGAVFSLELLGVEVTREGNIMLLNDELPVAVAEACSGLRMLTAFIVVAAVFAYVVKCPMWQKTTLVLSSIPVAILCNVTRLVATCLLFLVVDEETAQTFFHDFAGFVMIPLAIAMLVGICFVCSRLIVEPVIGGSDA